MIARVARRAGLTQPGAAFVTASAAGFLFWLAYSGGGYDNTTAAYAGTAIWWLATLGAVGSTGGVLSELQRPALTVAALLGAFAIWTLLSVVWAPDAGATFLQFQQAFLYLGVFLLALVMALVLPGEFLIAALALAVTATACIALVSRLFPGSFGVTAGASILPSITVRLSFPLGYWNGLGIGTALCYPLLLFLASGTRRRLAALWATAFPVLAAVIYLTSSRGAVATAIVGVVAYLLIAPRRWAGLGCSAVAFGGAALTYVVLSDRQSLVNGPVTSAAARDQGREAALLIAVICVLGGLSWLLLRAVEAHLPAVPAVVGQSVAAVLVVGAAAAVAAAHPIAYLQAFRRPTAAYGSPDFVTSHLLSSSGSGRWQFWSAALSEFRSHPLRGGGAGSYESYWAQHGALPVFVKNAHSLYLETLAELGLVGGILIVGFALVALVGGVVATTRSRDGATAGAAACGVAFCMAAGIDWIWQLPAVSIVGLAALGIALARPGLGREESAQSRSRQRLARGVKVLLVGGALAATVVQFLTLAAGLHLRRSRQAAANGRLVVATAQALEAKELQPWAAAPYTQLSLLAERSGDLDAAKTWIERALDRAHRDWRLWLIAARIDTRRGEVVRAQDELREVRHLNPHSALFPASPPAGPGNE